MNLGNIFFSTIYLQVYIAINYVSLYHSSLAAEIGGGIGGSIVALFLFCVLYYSYVIVN